MSCRKSGYSFKCIIKSCGEMKTQTESISFFSFPKDPARCEIWLERCQLPADTLSQKNVKLCGKHFEKIMFLNFLENRLKPDAIPTLFPDKKDNCDVSASTDLSSEKIRTCTSVSNTVSCGSNTPLKITDDPGCSRSCTSVTYGNNEILALPLPASPGVPDSIDYANSPGTSSFSSEKSRYFDSPSDFTSPSSSKGCQTLKSRSEKTPRKVLLRQQLKIEKEARLKAEKTILALSNQLKILHILLLQLCLYSMQVGSTTLTFAQHAIIFLLYLASIFSSKFDFHNFFLSQHAVSINSINFNPYFYSTYLHYSSFPSKTCVIL